MSCAHRFERQLDGLLQLEEAQQSTTIQELEQLQVQERMEAWRAVFGRLIGRLPVLEDGALTRAKEWMDLSEDSGRGCPMHWISRRPM